MCGVFVLIARSGTPNLEYSVLGNVWHVTLLNVVTAGFLDLGEPNDLPHLPLLQGHDGLRRPGPTL